MYTETTSGDMALALSQGQETTLNINRPIHRQRGGNYFVPEKYLKGRPQLQIPQGTNPTSYPAPPTILPSQASPSSHHSRHSSESPSTNDTSNMVWEQPLLSSSTASEPLYLPQMTHCGKSLSSQMFTMVTGGSPPLTSASLHSPPFFPAPVDDINFVPSPYGRSNSMPMFPAQYNMQAAPGYNSADLEFDSPMETSVSPEGYYLPHGRWTPPPHGFADDLYGSAMMDSAMMPGTPPGSAIYANEPREIRHINQPYYPDQSGIEEDVPPYAELIYMALMSAPNHQMHLQDIYQWFRDNYKKFRVDQGKGWMNSIRHNLSMNGAFVKVERPSGEPGKGYMWLLAPAAVDGGIKSTTRYRKKGRAVERVAMSPDASYDSFVTPKRNRNGKKSLKARRTIRKKIQRRQHVDQPQQQQPEPSSFPDFDTTALVHTPISDMQPMTPDLSSYHSEGFSETLSISSRHATPALRPTEWQSPASVHGYPSPAYYPQSDDGFSSSFDATPNAYSMCGPYDGDFDNRNE